MTSPSCPEEPQEVAEILHRAVERFFTPRPSKATARGDELQRSGTNLSLGSGLAATSWGEGPTVLLAHGWESRRTHWGAFVPALVGAGFRAVAVDAPAHGDSPGLQANVLEYGQKLVETGRDLPRLAGVVGHSFGAGAASVSLHLGLSADRAVLISGPASLSGLITRWALHHGIAEEHIPGFLRRVSDKVGVPIESLDLARLGAGMTCPALVIHDRGDEAIPLTDAEAVASAWKGSRLRITERYGHLRILIAREVVREVVDFLKS